MLVSKEVHRSSCGNHRNLSEHKRELSMVSMFLSALPVVCKEHVIPSGSVCLPLQAVCGLGTHPVSVSQFSAPKLANG